MQMQITTLVTVITTTSNRVIPSKNVWPRNSIDWLVSPERPFGRAELEKFQAVLPQHQIKVISCTPPYQVIFVGTPPQRTTKIIRIIKEDDHYNGCNSFNGFMSNSYC